MFNRIVNSSHLIFPQYWCKLYVHLGNMLGVRECSPRSLAFAAPFTTVAVQAAQAVQVTLLTASELDTETWKGMLVWQRRVKKKRWRLPFQRSKNVSEKGPS
jgi:hypothetical protein